MQWVSVISPIGSDLVGNQRYEPTGQAPAGISPQGAGNEPKEIQGRMGWR
jgi:hypothetical protein